MSASDHLSPQQFKVHFIHEPYTADQSDVDAHETPYLTSAGQSMPLIRAMKGDREVGHIQLYPTGHVAGLEVDPQHQRQGIATGLWKEAVRAGYGPKHYPDRQTAEGTAWARSLKKKTTSFYLY